MPKRILLAVITENNQCSVAFTHSLVTTLRFLATTQIDAIPVFFPSLGNWAMAANQAITAAWANNLDGLVLINPNVSWEPEAFASLCTTDKDAVAVPVSTQGGFHVTFGEITRLQEDEETGEVKVAQASLDFFYLSQYSIGQLAETHPTVSYRNEDTKLILQSGDIYASYHTHDEVLAYRLRELGIEVWLNPSYTASLYESTSSVGNFAAVLAELKAQ